MEFVELHLFFGIDVDRRLEYDEEHITVSLDFGPLVSVKEIVDEDRMQVPG